MKIHVFTVIEESYHHGDLDKSDKRFFNLKELRDDYYESLIRYYKNGLQLVDHGNGDFDDNHAWSYHIGKGEEDLEIIEEKNW
jgi:hypothetical protein